LSVEALDNDQVQLSWSQSVDSYHLEKASPLSSPSVWVNVQAEVVTSGGTNTLVTDIAGLNQFYRLRLDIPNTTVALGEGSGEVPLGFKSPPNPTGADLVTTITDIPTNGTLKKKDSTIVTADTIVTIAELMELTFTLAEVSEGLEDSDLIYIIDYGEGVVVSVTVSFKIVESSSGALLWTSTPQTGSIFFFSDGEQILEPMGNLPDMPFFGNFYPIGYVNGKFLFLSQNDTESGIFAFDGTDYSLVAEGTISNEPGIMVGNRYYYVATSPETGWELGWTDFSNGNNIIDIIEGSQPSSPRDFVILNGTFYFRATVDNFLLGWFKIDEESNTAVEAILPENAELPIDRTREIFYYSEWTPDEAFGQTQLHGFDGINAAVVADTNASGDDLALGVLPFLKGVVFRANDGTKDSNHYFYMDEEGAHLNVFEGPFLSPSSTYFTGDQLFNFGPGGDDIWSFDGEVASQVDGAVFDVIIDRKLYENFVALWTRGLPEAPSEQSYWVFNPTESPAFSQPKVPEELGGGSYYENLMPGTFVDGHWYLEIGGNDSTVNVTWDGGDVVTYLPDKYGNTGNSTILLNFGDMDGNFIFSGATPGEGFLESAYKPFNYDGESVTEITGANSELLHRSTSPIVFQDKFYFVSSSSTGKLACFDGTDVLVVSDHQAKSKKLPIKQYQ
jgi:hypothetical protein